MPPQNQKKSRDEKLPSSKQKDTVNVATLPAVPAPTTPATVPATTTPAAVRSEGLQFFLQLRTQSITDGRFLNWAEFESRLVQKFGRRLPKDVSEAALGLRAMLTEVHSAVDAIFATHHVVTLFELESLVLRSSTQFEAYSSFDEVSIACPT